MDYDNLTRDDLINVRISCDESLLYFTRFWYRILRGSKFIVSNHHEVICSEIARLERYELELLNINIPPRFSKTELAAVNFIARGIGMNPCANYLYITASDELRAQTSVSIRDIVTHPYFKIMYGVELKKDQNGKNLWRTNKGGGLKTATIFGQVTGFGAGQMIEHDTELDDYIRTFEGCIVLDDINKIDDAGQENANNEKVSRVLFNTILSRKNSKDTPMINIQQRAGVSDATAQLMDFYADNPKAKFLVMPVISRDGVPLWEFKHNLEDIERLKTSPLTSSTFETQYMQNPLDVMGLLCPIQGLTFSTYTDEHSGSFAFCDPADTGGDKLSVAFVKVYINGNRINAYIHDIVHTNNGIEATAPIINEKIIQYNVEECWIESNGLGLAMVLQLKNIISDKKIIKPTHSKDPKDIRIMRNYEFVNSSFVFNEKYKDKFEFNLFIGDLTTFKREGANKNKKDALDVCCYAAEVLKIKYRSVFLTKC